MNFEQDIKNLNYQGYTILKNFLSKKECLYYINLIEKYCTKEYNEKLGKVVNKKWSAGWLHNLQNKDINFLKLLNNEYLEKILKFKLNDKFYGVQKQHDPNYILQIYSARSSGNQYLDLHTDMRAKSTYDSTLGLTVLFYLKKTNKSNGCTILVPGSHNINLRDGVASYITDRSYKNITTVEADEGDVIIFDQGLWHGALPNNTNKKSWRIMMGFQRWWIKQSFDITSSLPKNIYNKISSKEKSILGFCSIPPKDETKSINSRISYDDLINQ